MDTLLPKVLVVGITAWRSDSSAHTLMDIFKCWDSQKLALVYTRSDLPSSDVAYRYFQISEGRVLKSITNWGIHTGREVEKSEEENESIIVEEHERYRKGRSRRSSILAVLREIVWLMGHWKSKELRSFLSDYNPDILFMPVYPVDALEKQVPQKPLHRYKRLGFVVEGCCPVCEVSVLPEQVFCAQCGQAIDWSEE